MLNWLTRYAFVHDALEFDVAGHLRESVLDVGCGPHGLATVAPNAQFAGVDLDFPGPVAPGMLAFRNEPGPLPFADAAFDTVVCLDVLEHVPPGERAAFVDELARVAARRVLVACPSDEGAWIDALLRDAYAARGIAAPAWLTEHDEHGLPTAAEIARFCAAPQGFEARELTMTNGLLSVLAVIADMLPEFADRAAAEWRDERERWQDLFARARFGSCYRKGYELGRVEARAPVVDPARLAATALAAARCPRCSRHGLEPDGQRVVCGDCSHSLVRDANGAWDMTLAAAAPPACSAASAPVPHPVTPTRTRAAASEPAAAAAAPARRPAAPRTSARRRLLLTPDWERPSDWLPVLARYVRAADPGGDTALCLDATATDLPAQTVYEMLALACDAISGGRDFAEVLVLDEPVEDPDAIAVRSARDVGDALGAGPLAAPHDPAEVAERARQAKRLADATRAIASGWRYRSAPDPWAQREPLVSVRIATWNGARLLVERAIPSVLTGSYGNVEVVVCSDGPDPEARAAVDAIRDPRVRYLELPERPTYPGQPWSFWETAGIHAVNRALDDCRGAFVAPLDHDDAFTHDHIHTLLGAGAGRDLVYGQALMEDARGAWHTIGSAPLAHGQVTHGSVLYSGRLAHMRMDPDCWLLDEPGDWNMWRRISALGAPVAFVPQVVLLHFRERASIDTGDGRDPFEHMTRLPAQVVADVQRTGLEWLLEIPLDLALAA